MQVDHTICWLLETHLVGAKQSSLMERVQLEASWVCWLFIKLHIDGWASISCIKVQESFCGSLATNALIHKSTNSQPGWLVSKPNTESLWKPPTAPLHSCHHWAFLSSPLMYTAQPPDTALYNVLMEHPGSWYSRGWYKALPKHCYRQSKPSHGNATLQW